MKSILLASKPSNNNQLSVGSQIRRNDSSIPISPHQHQHLSGSTTTESVPESNEKEHFNKLFSNSKKQVIRSRCSVRSDIDKVRRVTAEVFDPCYKNTTIDSTVERVKKLQTTDNGSEVEYLENRPLIVDNTISVDGEAQEKSAKLINLRKKNGTTLIFQKKSSAQKHPKANEYQELESFKKRRSLQQWPNSAFNITTETNVSRHSWYDTDLHTRAIEEEFDETAVSI